MPLRYRHERVMQILFRNPVGCLQLFGAYGSFVRGLWTLLFDPEVWNPSVAYAFFHYFPEWLWAGLLICVGAVQWWAAGSRRWQAQFWSANIQAGMLVYPISVTILTGNIGASSLPLSLAFLTLQCFVAMRVLHDKAVADVLDPRWAADGPQR